MTRGQQSWRGRRLTVFAVVVLLLALLGTCFESADAKKKKKSAKRHKANGKLVPCPTQCASCVTGTSTCASCNAPFTYNAATSTCTCPSTLKTLSVTSGTITNQWCCTSKSWWHCNSCDVNGSCNSCKTGYTWDSALGFCVCNYKTCGYVGSYTTDPSPCTFGCTQCTSNGMSCQTCASTFTLSSGFCSATGK